MIEEPRPAREPLLNAPWPALALVAAICAAYVAQSYLMSDRALSSMALSGQALRDGRWATLVSHLFLHGGWGHLLMNAAAAFAFGPPVARLFGRGAGGAVLFFGFFLLCGAIAGLGYVALNWMSQSLLIGASGAISGLWGAASRLLGQGGVLAPVLKKAVLQQAAAFAVINVLFGLLAVYAGLNIGWQAHLIGYAAGLLLIGPVARLAHRPV